MQLQEGTHDTTDLGEPMQLKWKWRNNVSFQYFDVFKLIHSPIMAYIRKKNLAYNMEYKSRMHDIQRCNAMEIEHLNYT